MNETEHLMDVYYSRGMRRMTVADLIKAEGRDFYATMHAEPNGYEHSPFCACSPVDSTPPF